MSIMEKLDFKSICRVCLGEGTMMSLFKVSMHRKIMAIASIQVWPNDGLPSQICRVCASKLHIAFQLKKQCEKSDLKLRQYQNTSQSNNKEIVEEEPANAIENEIPQQIEVQNAQRVFIQPNNSILIDHVRPEQSTYDHFMTVAHQNEIQQVAYANIGPVENQIQIPAYNMQGQMIYNTHQYTIQTQPIQPSNQQQIIQLEINPPVTQLPPSQKDMENNENLEKNIEVKESQDGKACGTCGKIFRTNIKLNRHMKIHTTLPSDLPHKCQVCGKRFSHAGNFKIHLRIHNNERPFKCSVCGRGCRQAQDLEKHLRTHTGERPHKCSFCPKAFATSSNLTAHVRTHTGERPYVCCVCQKAFCQSNELTKHMRTHTGEKSHVCDICQKGFNGSSGLLTHRRQHTGERPYICHHCNRGFVSSNCLSAHVKTHNKLYPIIKCAQCQSTFRTLANLKEHINSDHSASEVIQCKLCESTFGIVNDYLVHMRQHEEQS